MTPTAIGLYSGGGGIEAGFTKAGFKVLFSTDHWNLACDSLEKNFPSTVIQHADIREIAFNEIKKQFNVNSIDCVFGGPPCPAYSKSRFYRKEKKRTIGPDKLKETD